MRVEGLKRELNKEPKKVDSRVLTDKTIQFVPLWKKYDLLEELFDSWEFSVTSHTITDKLESVIVTLNVTGADGLYTITVVGGGSHKIAEKIGVIDAESYTPSAIAKAESSAMTKLGRVFGRYLNKETETQVQEKTGIEIAKSWMEGVKTVKEYEKTLGNMTMNAEANSILGKKEVGEWLEAFKNDL